VLELWCSVEDRSNARLAYRQINNKTSHVLEGLLRRNGQKASKERKQDSGEIRKSLDALFKTADDTSKDVWAMLAPIEYKIAKWVLKEGIRATAINSLGNQLIAVLEKFGSGAQRDSVLKQLRFIAMFIDDKDRKKVQDLIAALESLAI